jgi:hypothetical protein
MRIFQLLVLGCAVEIAHHAQLFYPINFHNVHKCGKYFQGSINQ